jgi:hypothetical protein
MLGECNKCGHVSEGIVVGKRHRRCGAQKGTPPNKPKPNPVPPAHRGVWQKG